MTPSVFIVDSARTAIGSRFQGLKDFSAARLAAVVMADVLKRTKISKKLVGEVILGHVVSAGTGQNVSRQAAILAGLPVGVPAFSVNHVCGSGLQAVILGARSIVCGEKDLIVAGGTESASLNPQLYFSFEDVSGRPFGPPRDQNPIESLVYDGLWCQLTDRHMGHLAEATARRFKISRREQDEYTLESHRKACQAQQQGKFHKEIVPVVLAGPGCFEKDDRPRWNIDSEKLSVLPPAFKKNGTITAGNSSAPCDGAAAVILAAGNFVKHHRLLAQARLLGYASVVVDPREVFTAGIKAVRECFKRCRLSRADIDLFEISEAFAAQAILTRNQLKIPEEKMNIWGGDLALGHPLGATATRSLVTLLHALQDTKKTRGMVCVCLGGGGAIALAVEMIA